MTVRWPATGRARNIGGRMPKLLIVDDDARIREALRFLVEGSGEIEVVGEAATIEGARALLARDTPDVVLLDLGLPDGSGVDLLNGMRAAGRAPIAIVLTVFDDDTHIFDALRAGAVGYLLKDEIVHRLLPSLREALEGGAPMSPSVARRVLESFHLAPPSQPTAPEEAALTPREHEVVELIARGATYEEVGRMLGVSTNTVRSHIRRAYEKLHVSSKAEATREAMRRGIVKG